MTSHEHLPSVREDNGRSTRPENLRKMPVVSWSDEKGQE